MPRQYRPGRYEIAARDTTDPNELADLAQRGSSAVRCAVARNRCTPPATLATLAAAEDSYVCSAVAANPYTPPAALTDLAHNPDVYTAKALAANPSTPPHVLAQLAHSAVVEIDSRIASNPSTPLPTLVALAGSNDAQTRAGVAKNPNTPDDILITLTRDQSTHVIRALAGRHADRNTRTRQVSLRRFNGFGSRVETITVHIQDGGRFSEPLMRAFVASRHLDLTKAVASQPDAPHDLLSELATHYDTWIRVRVAENRASDESILLALLAQGGSEVTKAIAERPSLPDMVLEAIALSRVTTAHQRLDADTPNRLLASSNPRVRTAAARFIPQEADALWQRMLTDPEKVVRVAAAKVAPLGRLRHHAAHPCDGVRQVVAARCADTALLQTLSTDPSPPVRRAVARNSACPMETLGTLAEDTDARVRAYASEQFLTVLARPLA